MARDLLTVLVSTVASEYAFSASNRQLDERRIRLIPEHLECIVCLKDWDDASLRAQNLTDDITEDFQNLNIAESNEERKIYFTYFVYVFHY